MNRHWNIGQMKTEAVVSEGNQAWFVHMEYNALFETDVESGKCKYLGYIPQEEICMHWLYVNMKKYGNYLVLAPFMANDIALYDIEKNIYIKIELKKYQGNDLKEKFSDLIIYKNKIFFIPMVYSAIVCLDMDTLNVEYIEDIVNDIELRRLNQRYNFNKPIQQKEVLWIGCFATNCIIEYHMDTCKYIFHKVQKCQKGMSGIAYQNGEFWMVQFPQYRIVSWNLYTKEERIYDKFPLGFEGRIYPFSHIVCDKQRILLLPEQANMILSLNLKTKTIDGAMRHDIERTGEVAYCTYFKFKGEQLYITGKGAIVRLSENLQEEQVSVLYLEQKDEKDIYEELSAIEVKRKTNEIYVNENILGISALTLFLKEIADDRSDE